MTISVREAANSEDWKGEPASAAPCEPTEEQVAVCAYFIWQSEGRPHGCDREHWIQAEEQLRLSCWHEQILESSPGR